MVQNRSAQVKPKPTIGTELAMASRNARQRSSSALYLLASAFLAAAVLRANDLRHDLVSLVASPAYAAAPAGATGGEDTPLPPTDGQAGPTAAAMPGASAASPQAPAQDSGPMPAGSGSGDPSAAPALQPACLDGTFLAAAREREQELEAMGLALDNRRRELEVVERRIAAQLAELARQQEALQVAFGQAEAAAEQEAMQLVSIYEQMKPKQAAPIFDQMPPEIAAGFVRRMRKASSALILANMDPQKAFAISLLLAGRSGAVRHQ